MREALLEKLSNYDYKPSFSKACRERYEGTGLWLFECAEFRGWKEEDGSCGLWLYGIRKQYLSFACLITCSQTVPDVA